VNAANRGDVIFVAETVQGALTGTTRAAVNMDTTVSVASGLRVAFEEGSNRAVNTTAQLTVNLTGEVKSSSVIDFLGHSSSALELLGTANINVNGSTGSDIIVGNKGKNVINGLAGNDLIFGGNGADMLIGGIGDDTLVGGSGHKASAVANFMGEAWSLFNVSTDAITTNDPQALEFKTGDKVVYTATGGTGMSAYIGGAATTLTSSTALYVIRTDNADGTASFKMASSQANALNGVFLDVISNGTATSHAFTLDNVTYSATTLPGNDYLYGGSGNDHLIATGVMGSLTTAATRDTLTMNGGSGADTFTVLSNTGQINVFGGSGADKFEVMDVFMDAVGVNKGERIVDFSATQDDVQSYFTAASLGSTSIEARLNAGGVTLSQLVAPPLPIVDGSGENGNYQAVSDQVNSTYALPDFGLSVADLLNIHNAHAA
jgi:Ca2+-binding RTX toxin-like protein